MKNILLLALLFSTIFCLAQTPKKKILTEEDVVKIVKRIQASEDAFILKDTDEDGVIDQLDREPNTPKDCGVDTHGMSLDSDGDGIKDCDDKEPFTYPTYPPDPVSVVSKPIPCVCDFSTFSVPYKQHFNPVYFTTHTSTLSAETQVYLKTISVAMLQNTSTCLAIEGYVSEKETKDVKKALNLSYNRAKAISDFMCNNYGINSDRLKVKIKGNNDIVKIINTPKDYTFNQRVEFYMVPCTETSDEAPSK
jgi:OmpA-OmpF porin, OOP family